MNNYSQHKMWLLANKDNETLAGAIVEMSAPISSNKQWQAFLNNILFHLDNVDRENPISGTYAISFTPTTGTSNYASMVLSKLTGESFDETMAIVNLPEGTLGLLHIFNDPIYNKVAVLSLIAGDFSDKGAFSPNRILASTILVGEVSTIRKNNTSTIIYDRVLDVGKTMLNLLDSSMIVRGYNS